MTSRLLLALSGFLFLAGCTTTNEIPTGALNALAFAPPPHSLLLNGEAELATGAPVKVYVLYGQFGATFSPGMTNLAERLRALSPRLEVATYDWSDYAAVVSDIRNQPKGTRFVIVGYSLGANATTWISSNVQSVQIDLIVAYDPSVLSIVTPAGSNVRRAILYHNNSPESLGHARITGPTVEVHESTTSHLAVQFSEQLHAVTFDAVRQVLDSDQPYSDSECRPAENFVVSDVAPQRPDVAMPVKHCEPLASTRP
jgi:hypothetical protein